ncbi:hypothetical protein B0H14DRAFT_3144018 [Mycena olivaceomarginata]|nr:hypothetical protein B0H14DRAFT_3144018 [Mycena olivaceomarginata]
MWPSAPPTGRQVSNSYHARPPPPSPALRIGAPREAITVAVFLLLSAFLCGLVVGLAKCARSYWHTPRSTSVVRWWEKPNGLRLDSARTGEGLLHPPPPPYFLRPPLYVDDCGENPIIKDDLAVDSRFDSGRPQPSGTRHVFEMIDGFLYYDGDSVIGVRLSSTENPIACLMLSPDEWKGTFLRSSPRGDGTLV